MSDAERRSRATEAFFGRRKGKPLRERQAQQVQGNAAVQDKAVSAPRSACADTGSRWNRLRKKDPGCVSSD